MECKLLDVTLRDGGYQNKFGFDADLAAKTVFGLGLSGIDAVEIGYRNGSLKKIEGIGQAGICNDEYIAKVRETNPKAIIFVMAHPKNINEKDIYEMRNAGASGVRLCVDHGDLEKTFSLMELARNLGLFVTSNLTRASQLPIERIQELAKRSEGHGANVVYFADSNGSMLPDDVSKLTKAIGKAVKIEVGFHAHNNLSMALANSITAVDNGAKFIDASLRGMGRGAGNLATELYVSYLERIDKNLDFDLPTLFKLTEKWEQKVMADPMTIRLDHLLFGMANFSADFEAPIKDFAKRFNLAWFDLAYQLSLDNNVEAPSESSLQKACKSCVA